MCVYTASVGKALNPTVSIAVSEEKVRMHRYMYMCAAYICIYMSMCIYTFVIYTLARDGRQPNTYMHIYTYIYMDNHIYIYIYVCILYISIYVYKIYVYIYI
jgi:hypothetical protein